MLAEGAGAAGAEATAVGENAVLPMGVAAAAVEKIVSVAFPRIARGSLVRCYLTTFRRREHCTLESRGQQTSSWQTAFFFLSPLIALSRFDF